jgi:hypothetical protein
LLAECFWEAIRVLSPVVPSALDAQTLNAVDKRQAYAGILVDQEEDATLQPDS